MFILLVLGTVAAPAFMFVVRFLAPRASITFDSLGIAAMYGFGWCATRAVFDVLVEDTVMMTEVHKVLYNPVFLSCAAYLGVYALYTGWWTLFRRLRSEA